MKEKFKKEFILYRSRLFKELFYLYRRDLSDTGYKFKFEEFVFECDFQIDHFPTIYMFYNGLRPDFKRADLTCYEVSQRDVSFGFRARIVKTDVPRVRTIALCL